MDSLFTRTSSINIPYGSLLYRLRNITQTVFLIAENEASAEKIRESLSALQKNTLLFPGIELMPFSQGVPSPDILAERVRVLSLLRQNREPYTVVLSHRSLIRLLPPVRSFDKALILLHKGGIYPLEGLCSTLEAYGYTRSSLVRETGEYARKNHLLDIFPPDSAEPLRLIFEEDARTLARLAFFNPETQLSEHNTDSFPLAPLAEFMFPKDKEGFIWPSPLAHSEFLSFYSQGSPVTAYASGGFTVIFIESPEAEDNKTRAVFARLKAEHLLAPSFQDACKEARVIVERSSRSEPLLGCKQEGGYAGGFSGFTVELDKLLQKYGENLLICFFAEYEESARRIAIMLRRFHPRLLKNYAELPEDASGFYIITGNWEFGFSQIENGRCVLFTGESDVSGKRKLFRRRLKQALFTPFEKDIQAGDAVVHLNYGIGIFKGVERIHVLDKEKDYILIEYADKQKLFVPLEQADLIGRYTGSLDDAKKPRLDSLAGKSWQKKRVKAQEDIIRFAKALVGAHAKRIALTGTAFPPDGEEQKLFEDRFPYIETPDQIKVIEEIKADMEDPKPMDRLLCGDVGFGKTEIALRAAFKAIYAGSQAALLAPTTILAEQHYLTCLDRFKDFPVKIAVLTRFSEPEDRRDILKKIAAQEIDLLIGTHALLNKEVRFKKLGLLIIDEEHKFGVEQKEKIKQIYPLTDILSLSATPIPRTLSLALGSLRSFSTLQTPPELRVPVETIVSDFREDIVKEAVRTELDRGGQVYFIQNRIKELNTFVELIGNLVPEASIASAHGRMDEAELEDAFLGFMRGAYNVLVSTTIVESGLDIPNANTLIVSDSQRLGLSQLYQLKGRVGRSSRQAFAYFLFPEHKNITETANKRLDALAEYTELGAGFQIARQDMEIRGAGNILGEEQHGHLSAVGYDMYMRLLREEVQKLQGTFQDRPEPLVDLAYDAFIPDAFISDPALKMEAYKKILSLQEQDSTEELKKEFRDRYGPLPPELDTLFSIARLKIEAGKIGIASITEKPKHIEIIFSRKSQADPLKVLSIAQNGSHPVQFSPYNPHLLTYATFNAPAEQKVHRLMSFIRDIRE